ncbi:MAG TPA: DUF6677 family protein [Tepidisphaeraceae bacterium]|nr:DUF6677 family protein [Tepidisphaeraceae bacterium]
MKGVPPFLVVFVSWLFPGAGYWLMGQRGRAAVVGTSILILFLGGVLLAGIRVIDVPGYNDHGEKAMVDHTQDWMLTSHPFAAIFDKPWYVGQILAGPVTLICSKISIDAAQGENPYPKVKARIGEIGTLYTAIAGMLNLLAMIDAGHRAQRQGEPA